MRRDFARTVHCCPSFAASPELKFNLAALPTETPGSAHELGISPYPWGT